MREGVVDVVVLGVVRALARGERTRAFIHPHPFERDAIDHEVLRERTRGWTFGDVFGRGRRVGDDVRE